MKSRSLALTCLVVSILMPASAALAVGENIALGRSYSYTSAPNYSLCTDPCDVTQLTDGAFASYTEIGCVGWSGRGVVSVTIDLGSVEAIEGFGMYGGSANFMPAFVYMWVSDDNVTFSYAGELCGSTWASGLPDGGPLRGQATGSPNYIVHGLVHAGRYVKFTVFSTGYSFITELEVYAGGFDPGSVTPDPLQISSAYEQWALDNKHDGVVRLRMLYDLQELEKHSQAGSFAAQINSLRTQVLNMPWVAPLAFEDGLPYNSLHEDVFELNGQMNLAAGLDEFSVAIAEMYEPLHPFDTFSPASGAAELHMAGNEVRAAAFNVSNFSSTATIFFIALDWSCRGFPTDQVTLRQVRFTEIQQRAVVGSALPEVGPFSDLHWSVEIPKGVTGQLWLDFDSAGMAPGTYPAQLTVTPQGHAAITTDLSVRVYRGALPDEPTLLAQSWDYSTEHGSYDFVTAENKDDLLRVLAASRNNVPWCPPGQLGYQEGGTWNPDGTYSWYPSFIGFQEWVQDVIDNGGASRYYVFFNSAGTTFKGFAYPTTEWENAITSWYSALRGIIVSRGWDPSDFAFCIVDEPDCGHPMQRYADYQTVAKAAASEFLFFTDPSIQQPGQIDTACENFLLTCDIIMPSLGKLRSSPSLQSWYQSFAQTYGKELGTYGSAGGGRVRSPVNLFRRYGWEAQSRGLQNVGEWTSTSGRTNTWDDFGSTHNYEMPFTTQDSATPGKILMGWRDGSQDFEYFRILEGLIAQGQGLGVDPALLSTGQNLLDNLAGSTDQWWNYNQPWSYNSALNSSFDVARLQLLDAIDQLDAAVALALAGDCQDMWDAYFGEPADIDRDCHIGLSDFVALSDDWLYCQLPAGDCTDDWSNGPGVPADINEDCRIDLADKALLIQDWGACNDPCDVTCQ